MLRVSFLCGFPFVLNILGVSGGNPEYAESLVLVVFSFHFEYTLGFCGETPSMLRVSFLCGFPFILDILGVSVGHPISFLRTFLHFEYTRDSGRETPSTLRVSFGFPFILNILGVSG